MKEYKKGPSPAVAVIGGGVSGLSVCYRLERILPEAAVDLYEAESRPGGKVGSVRKNGFVFELGPDCFVREKPLPLQVAEETGNREAVINTIEENRGTFIYARGRLHELPEGLMSFVPTKFLPFVKTGLFSWPGKFRMALDLFLPRGKNDDPTLADFVVRRFGREAAERLAAPLVAGIYGSDPEELSLKATFPRFLDMEEKYRSLIIGFLAARRRANKKHQGSTELSYFLSFKEGMQQLIEILMNNLGRTRIYTSRPVARIESADGRLAVVDREGKKSIYDAVVLAVPAFAAAEILPESMQAAKSLLKEIKYNSVATVNLVFRQERIGKVLTGHGFVVAENEDLTISAATFMSNKWPFRAPEGYCLIRTFIGGGKKSYLAALSEEELIRFSIEDLNKVIKLKAEPEEAYVARYLKAMPLYAPGHLERVEVIFKEVSRIRGLFLTGSAYLGIGVPDCMRQGFESAEAVARFLQGQN